LCSNYPKHNDIKEIIAKVWLIGRSYAVAIERRQFKTEINDDFYIDHVGPAFLNSELDEKIIGLKEYMSINPTNLEDILNVHYYLTNDVIWPITHQDKRSFSSKYLHFHLPEQFFIYDSRATSALSKYIGRLPPELNFLYYGGMIDDEYAKFSGKCLHLKNQIKTNYGIELSNRQLDNLLIKEANSNLNLF